MMSFVPSMDCTVHDVRSLRRQLSAAQSPGALSARSAVECGRLAAAFRSTAETAPWRITKSGGKKPPPHSMARGAERLLPGHSGVCNFERAVDDYERVLQLF